MTLLLTKEIVQLFLILICGYALVKWRLVKTEDSRAFSVLLVYIMCPCSVLKAFQIPFTDEMTGKFGFSVAAALALHALLFLIVGLLKKPFRLDAVEQGSMLYSNAGSLIIPLVTAILGESYVIYASAFLVVQLFIIWTHGKSLIQGKWGMNLKAILLNANLIACTLGLLLFLTHTDLPPFAVGILDKLSACMGPLSMLMVGMLLAGADLRSIIRDRRIWLITGLKMLAVPALIILIVKLSGVTSLTDDGQTLLYISLLAVMTPAASTITQMAQLYDKGASHAAAINALTTTVCVVTMPLLTLLYYL